MCLIDEENQFRPVAVALFREGGIDLRQEAQRSLEVLGRYADRQMPGALSSQDQRADQALDYLYGREYDRRGLQRKKGPVKGLSRGAQRRLVQSSSTIPFAWTRPSLVPASKVGGAESMLL